MDDPELTRRQSWMDKEVAEREELEAGSAVEAGGDEKTPREWSRPIVGEGWPTAQ
jgi:hypothetical protein